METKLMEAALKVFEAAVEKPPPAAEFWYSDDEDRWGPYGPPLRRDEWRRRQEEERKQAMIARVRANPAWQFCRAVEAVIAAARKAGIQIKEPASGFADQIEWLMELGLPVHHAAHYVAWSKIPDHVMAGIYSARDCFRDERLEVARLLREARDTGARGYDSQTGIFCPDVAARILAAKKGWESARAQVRELGRAGRPLEEAAEPAAKGLNAIRQFYGKFGFPENEKSAIEALANLWNESRRNRHWEMAEEDE